MHKNELIQKINYKIQIQDFNEMNRLIFPLVEILVKEESYNEALNSLDILGKVMMYKGYTLEEKLELEEKKIDIYERVGNKREVLMTLKVIAETYNMLDTEKFPEKIQNCFDYYDTMQDPEPSDKEYLLAKLMQYYQMNEMHNEAKNLVKEIVRHKVDNQIPLILSDYYDCLYYEDKEETRKTIFNNIHKLITKKLYEIEMSEMQAMKDLAHLCEQLGNSSLKQLLLEEIDSVTSRDEYQFYKEFLNA